MHIKQSNSTSKQSTTSATTSKLAETNTSSKSKTSAPWPGKNSSSWFRYFTWNTISGDSTVINPEIKAYMTDNVNGTYSYSFMLTQSGKITILVYLEPPNPVLFELWPNINFSGTKWDSYWYPNINNTWVSGYLTSTYTINITGRFTTYLVPPVDDTYTIYYYHDDEGRVYFEDTMKTNGWRSSGSTDSFTVSMKAGQLYKIVPELIDYIGHARAYKL